MSDPIKKSLAERTSIRINKIINSPTHLSHPVKYTITSIMESANENIDLQDNKSFLPFVSERGTMGKILPAFARNSRIKKYVKENSETAISGSDLNSSKTKSTKLKLVSPRAYVTPPVGNYVIKSSLNSESSSKISKSPRLPIIKPSLSSTEFIDWNQIYKFKEKHHRYPDLKKNTGRDQNITTFQNTGAMSLISAKLPDKLPIEYGLLATVDVHGYMSEIRHIERNVKERFKDIYKAHKNLVKTMLI